MIIHVIKPSGTRFQYEYADATKPETILKELDSIKVVFGYNGTAKRTAGDGTPEVDWGDPASGLAYDHPDTQVAVVESRVRQEGRQRIEEAVPGPDGVPKTVKLLKGKPKE